MVKTIRRNSKKKIESIFSKATKCTAYSLENNFHGRECAPYWVYEQYNALGFAKLTERGPGKYQVCVHSNCWYEIESEG